jgi:hypothetical protein
LLVSFTFVVLFRSPFFSDNALSSPPPPVTGPAEVRVSLHSPAPGPAFFPAGGVEAAI